MLGLVLSQMPALLPGQGHTNAYACSCGAHPEFPRRGLFDSSFEALKYFRNISLDKRDNLCGRHENRAPLRTLNGSIGITVKHGTL